MVPWITAWRATAGLLNLPKCYEYTGSGSRRLDRALREIGSAYTAISARHPSVRRRSLVASYWLVEKDKLDLLRATQLTEERATYWRRPLGALGDVPEALPVGEPATEELEKTRPKLTAVMRKLFPRLKTVEREAIVTSPGGIFRLHRAGSYGCWMSRRRDFRDTTEFDAKPDKPLHPRLQAMLAAQGGRQ